MSKKFTSFAKRIGALALSALMLVGTMSFTVSAEEEWVDSGINYTESTESYVRNPGRGYAPPVWRTVYPDGKIEYAETKAPTGFDETGIACPMYSLAQFSSGSDYEPPNGGAGYYPVTENTSLVGGENMDITEEALDAIRSEFEAARVNGCVLIPRFGYAPAYVHDGRGVGIVGAEPDDIRWVARHMEQICEIINEYKDIIIAVEAGILGPWGEMHSTPYSSEEDIRFFMDTWFKHLDPDVSLLIRNLTYITKYYHITGDRFMKTLPLSKDDPFYRIGMYNDGYLLTGEDTYTWSHPDKPALFNIYRYQAIELLDFMGQNHPYGGEVGYGTLDYIMNGDAAQTPSPIYKTSFIEELYKTHLCYLHNILEESHNVLNELRRLSFEEAHAFEGMPDVSAYYGQSLHKLMYDHMGYRFVLRKAETTGTALPGDTVKLRGTIENVGFGHMLFSLKSELILIDESGNASFVPLSIDPSQYKSATKGDYDITLAVPSDATGTYKAYIRFAHNYYNDAAPNSTSVHIANDGIWNETYGANYVGSFTVEGEGAGNVESFEQLNKGAFEDVADGAWYREAVDFVTSEAGGKVMGGVSTTKFDPNGSSTRAMIVTILYRMAGSPDVSEMEDTPFTDVAENSWYAAPIKWAYNNQVVNGTSATTFSPNGSITREQFATILYRYAPTIGLNTDNKNDLSSFPDAADVSSYAEDALAWANGEGLIGGTTSGGKVILAPRAGATRAQLAQIIMRFIKL